MGYSPWGHKEVKIIVATEHTLAQIVHAISKRKGTIGPPQLIICLCIKSWFTFIALSPNKG